MPKRLDLLAYGPVGDWFGISAQDMTRQLAAAPEAEEVCVRIHSPGGDAMDGIAISNALRAHPGKVTCYVDGLAASAASMICMGADEVVMAENAVMMLHNPWGMAAGDGADLREQADALDALGRAYVAGYARKSGRPEADMKALMQRYSWRSGTWLTAEEAVKEGLADRVGPPVKAHARARTQASAGHLRAAALAAAPAHLRHLLATSERTEMKTIKDVATRLKAAKTEADRLAILAELEASQAEHEEPDGDEDKDASAADDEHSPCKECGKDPCECEDAAAEDDDEKCALRAQVQALKELVRTSSPEKQLSPEAWAEKQIKAGYPATQKAELIKLRKERPRAAELAAAAVLKAIPQARRRAQMTAGGAPAGTSRDATGADSDLRAQVKAYVKTLWS